MVDSDFNDSSYIKDANYNKDNETKKGKERWKEKAKEIGRASLKEKKKGKEKATPSKKSSVHGDIKKGSHENDRQGSLQPPPQTKTKKGKERLKKRAKEIGRASLKEKKKVKKKATHFEITVPDKIKKGSNENDRQGSLQPSHQAETKSILVPGIPEQPLRPPIQSQLLPVQHPPSPTMEHLPKAKSPPKPTHRHRKPPRKLRIPASDSSSSDENITMRPLNCQIPEMRPRYATNTSMNDPACRSMQGQNFTHDSYQTNSEQCYRNILLTIAVLGFCFLAFASLNPAVHHCPNENYETYYQNYEDGQYNVPPHYNPHGPKHLPVQVKVKKKPTFIGNYR